MRSPTLCHGGKQLATIENFRGQKVARWTELLGASAPYLRNSKDHSRRPGLDNLWHRVCVGLSCCSVTLFPGGASGLNLTQAFRELVQIGITLTSEQDLGTLLERILTE